MQPLLLPAAEGNEDIDWVNFANECWMILNIFKHRKMPRDKSIIYQWQRSARMKMVLGRTLCAPIKTSSVLLILLLSRVNTTRRNGCGSVRHCYIFKWLKFTSFNAEIQNRNSPAVRYYNRKRFQFTAKTWLLHSNWQLSRRVFYKCVKIFLFSFSSHCWQ